MFEGWRTRWMPAAAIALTICGWAAHAGDLSARYHFAIGPQSLSSALLAFSELTDIQVSTASADLKDLKSAGVSGERTAGEALEALFIGTDLTFRAMAGNAVAIEPRKAVGKQIARTAWQADDVLRLAQVERREQTATAQSAAEEDRAGSVPEVLVKGRRSLNMDIRRTADDAQPYVIFDRQTLEKSGAANLEDFFRTRLTQGAGAATGYLDSNRGISGSQTSINLRGLGANQTLILIDGRRSAGYYRTGAAGQPVLNGIPLAAIERIEVLPTTASAIYGGDATGGVVNIILRRDYAGAEAKLTYNGVFEGDSSSVQADLNYGLNFHEGRTNLMLAGSFNDGDDLLLGERNFAQRGRANILANNPAFFYGATTPPRSYTTNIRSADGSNLVLKSGPALGSPITFVPVGYPGISSDGGQAFVANAGRYNLELSDSAFIGQGATSGLWVLPRTQSLMATLRHEFNSRVRGFLEAGGSDVTQRRTANAMYINEILPASAPNNPFTRDVRVAGIFPHNDRHSESSTDSRRVAAGLIVNLPKQWMAAGDYTWSRSSTHFATQPTAVTVPRVASGALDVMRDLNAYPPDLSQEFAGLAPHDQASVGPQVSVMKNATLRLSGPTLAVPAGNIALTGLLERRDIEFEEAGYFLGSLAVGVPGATSIFPSRSQSVNSAYIETLIPLLKPLELQLAARHDDYTNNGVTNSTPLGSTTPPVRVTNKVTSTNPTVALRYRPAPDVMLRTSYGTGFLPPSLSQLTPSTPSVFTGQGAAVDPKRGGQGVGNPNGTWRRLTGGNPDLDPEESESWSAGVVFSPRILPGVRFSIDYTRIDKTDNIVSLNDQQTLDNEDFFPGLVNRGARLPTDPVGWLGPVIELDERANNIARAELEAFDVQLDYHFDTARLGSFDLFALATRTNYYRTQVVPTAPIVEQAGVTSNNPLKFKANAGLSWNYRQWTVGWLGYYYDSYFVADPTSAGSATAFLNQGARRVPSQHYHDVFAAYRFGPAAQTEIQAGIKNIFNKEPPYDYSNNAAYYSYFGDPRLANFYLSFKKGF